MQFVRYIQHSNEKITRAVHSVMVSFLSSGNDTDQDDRVALQEQLAFDYIRRSLEVVHSKPFFILFFVPD